MSDMSGHPRTDPMGTPAVGGPPIRPGLSGAKLAVIIVGVALAAAVIAVLLTLSLTGDDNKTTSSAPALKCLAVEQPNAERANRVQSVGSGIYFEENKSLWGQARHLLRNNTDHMAWYYENQMKLGKLDPAQLVNGKCLNDAGTRISVMVLAHFNNTLRGVTG